MLCVSPLNSFFLYVHGIIIIIYIESYNNPFHLYLLSTRSCIQIILVSGLSISGICAKNCSLFVLQLSRVFPHSTYFISLLLLLYVFMLLVACIFVLG